MVACALIAGRRENDVGELVTDLRTLGETLMPLAKKLGGG